MFLPGLLVNKGSPQAEFDRVAAVTLVRRHELDAAVTVLMVVPIHERHHPLTGLCLAGKRPVWVVRTVFDRAEQGFRVWIVIRHPWPGEQTQHPQLFQPGLERGGAHGVAVVGVQNQRLATALVLIRSRRPAGPTRSAANCASSRSATSQATTLRLQTSITK